MERKGEVRKKFCVFIWDRNFYPHLLLYSNVDLKNQLNNETNGARQEKSF